jgi:hypothetical protein
LTTLVRDGFEKTTINAEDALIVATEAMFSPVADQCANPQQLRYLNDDLGRDG